jgi:hypothetical protein
MRACVTFLALACVVFAGCGELVAEGGRCIGPSDCVDGTTCVAVAGSGLRCLRSCDPAATFLCESGAVCLAVEGSTGACAIGGPIPLGEECERSAECGSTAICVTQGSDLLCRQACDPAGTPACACVALTNGGGYCPPDPDAGP